MKWNSGIKKTESGSIPFLYTQLSQLKDQLQSAPLPKPDLSKKVKMMSLSKEYETGIIPLFHATSDLNHRSE